MEKGEDLNKILKMPSADFSSGAGFQMTREKRHCFVEALLYESDKFQNLLSFKLRLFPTVNTLTCHFDRREKSAEGFFCNRRSERSAEELIVALLKFYVYLTTNPNQDALYVGMTNNLEQRIIEHFLEKGKPETHAGKYYCYNLVFYEEYKYVNTAIDREKEIKK